MLKEESREKLERIAKVLLGTAVLAFATALFLIPFELVTGGVSGLGIAVARVSGLSAELLIAIFTAAFFLVGLAFFGKDFFFKTVLSSLVYPPLVSIFGLLRSERVLGGIFILERLVPLSAALFLSAVLGGLLVGVGCALSFLGGGSTGGLDVAALIVADRQKRLSVGSSMLLCDAAVVILGAFAIADLCLTALGIISAALCSLSVSLILRRRNAVKKGGERPEE